MEYLCDNQHRLMSLNEMNYAWAFQYYICHGKFNDIMLRDADEQPGKDRHAADEQCNLNLLKKYNEPIFFQTSAAMIRT